MKLFKKPNIPHFCICGNKKYIIIIYKKSSQSLTLLFYCYIIYPNLFMNNIYHKCIPHFKIINKFQYLFL